MGAGECCNRLTINSFMLSSPVSSSNTDEIIIMFPSRKSPDREDFTNRRKRCRTCETSWSGHL